jgi:hypothetical protein
MFAQQPSSPVTRTISPFKHPRPPPSMPGQTANVWNKYERRAVENVRRREGCLQSLQSQRCSASTIPRTSTATTASAQPSFDFKFRGRQKASSSTASTFCKTCQQLITYTSGICEPCKKTIIMSSSTGATAPQSKPSAQTIPSQPNQDPYTLSLREEVISPKATSPKRRHFCPLPTQLIDPPIRLSSLRPPPTQNSVLELNRGRKTSLTDPNEPFLRLQIAQTRNSHSSSHPTSPTYPPTTPPSTSRSRSSTRPASLATTVAALSPVAVHIPTHPYARHNSVTPSELSTLYPCASATTTSRPSVSSTAYGVNQTASVWDDWDSDEEEEKAGLVGYLREIGKVRVKKERSDSKTSLDSVSAKLSSAREEERKKSREQRRASQEKEQRPKSSGSGKKRRPSGFVRVISCGRCSRD